MSARLARRAPVPARPDGRAGPRSPRPGTHGRHPGALRITQVLATEQFAGTERYVVDVSAELARRGHDVHVIGGNAATVPRLLPAEVGWREASRLTAVVAALARNGRRDLVHSHITRADFAALLAAPATGGRRLSTRHITNRRGYTSSSRRFARMVRAGLAREIAVSQFVSDRLERPADVVLLNGVPDVADAADATDRQPVVLLAQRLAPEKDTATALRAWARAGLAAQGWRLIVAGEGDERPALERLASELGIAASCAFVGWVDDLDERYRAASILLAPAPTEPCGLTILEAMARGLPVVAAGAAGHAETIGREPSAALFPPGDADGAAVHLARLAADPAARARYGAALRTLQRRWFSIEVHVDHLEGLYRQVTDRTAHRRTG